MNSHWRHSFYVRLLGVVLGVMMGALVVPGLTNAEDDPVIAIVNGHKLRLSYVYAQIESLPLGDQVSIRAQLDRFIESIVREEALFQSMIATDFSSEPELREEIKQATVKYLIKRHVEDRIRVTDEAVRDFYQTNAGAIRGEHVRASQIVMAKREQCDALRQSIKSLGAFETAAREHSLDQESARLDGDIGRFMNHTGPYGFEVELFDMQVDEMRVFESSKGCHLVRITEHVVPPLPPLREVEPRIRSLLERQQEIDLLSALMERSEKSITLERRPQK